MANVFTENEKNVLKLIFKFNGDSKKISSYLKANGGSFTSFTTAKHFLLKRMRLNGLLEAILSTDEGKAAFKKIVYDFLKEVHPEECETFNLEDL